MMVEGHDSMGILRPVTWWREQVLSGAISMGEASPSVRSWLRHDIYQGAREICLIENIEERRNALQGIPALIRPYVEAEIKRLWPLRHEL
jgi:hypothetical protein